jgi:hypothetical protein
MAFISFVSAENHLKLFSQLWSSVTDILLKKNTAMPYCAEKLVSWRFQRYAKLTNWPRGQKTREGNVKRDPPRVLATSQEGLLALANNSGKMGNEADRANDGLFCRFQHYLGKYYCYLFFFVYMTNVYVFYFLENYVHMRICFWKITAKGSKKSVENGLEWG